MSVHISLRLVPRHMARTAKRSASLQSSSALCTAAAALIDASYKIISHRPRFHHAPPHYSYTPPLWDIGMPFVPHPAQDVAAQDEIENVV
jgi:hypothetical protein